LVDAPTRVAILGIAIESHRYAPALTGEELERHGVRRGPAVLDMLALEGAYGFAARLSVLRRWEAVPILLAGDTAGGPLAHRSYVALRAELQDRLRAAGRLDAVYVDAHGAGLTTKLDDMDGDYFATVRQVVGDIPIVATLDLHGKISRRMFASADAMIAMHTNPHVDLPARRDDAAVLIHRMVQGGSLHGAWLRVPLITPQVTQLTTPGAPLAHLMRLAREAEAEGDIVVSLLSGFAFSDAEDTGFNVCAYSWVSQDHARQVVERLADATWSIRDQFSAKLTALKAATDIALAAGRGLHPTPVILADVSDNPGGGGRGNTTHVLNALLDAGVDRAAIGPIYDPLLVQEAHKTGLGNQFVAHFNADGTEPASGTLKCDARVLALQTRTAFTPDHGVTKGLPSSLGATCVLQCNGIQVAVATVREQTYSADYLAACGVEMADVAVFVVKSRGHFRAGFSHLVPEELIFEVDAPGLTTPHLHQMQWRGLRRPIYPLDLGMHWSAEGSVRTRSISHRR
jgi:microcystin degradation protein MlrC